MKGDFSRLTFDPRKHYAGVLMQQGRVQVDADWNEQEAIQRRRTQVETRDVIGRCGAPRDAAGFAIELAGNKLTIGAGRFYVDGLLAESEDDALAYESQADLLDPPAWQDALKEAGSNLGLVYLDVWERHVTPLDDRLLREVALGGPDTATRVKTVWQVRVLALAATGDAALLKKLRAQRDKLQKKLDEVAGNAADAAAVKEELARIDARLAEITARPGCDDQIDEWDALVADPDRTLNARSQPPTNVDGPCVVPPTAGYRRLENQLYRVEVHQAGPRATATFKWSRDNGTVVTAVESIAGKDVIVHDLGPDDVLGFADGQWVELTDDRLELAGLPGQLLQIDSITASQRRITLKAAPTPLAAGGAGVDPIRHPKLRRWDQKTGGTDAGVAMAAEWIALEDGVEVQFSDSTFRTGDYWTIPARTATGELEWPPFAIPNAAPEPQPPAGIRHHYCRLALIALDAGKEEWSVVEDCRTIFPPLTDCCDETSAAIHVVATNWVNDDVFDGSTLAKEGLRVRLDAPPDAASLTNETFQVFVDAPLGQGANVSGIPFHRVYVPGVVGRDPADATVAVWRPSTATAGIGLAGPTIGASIANVAFRIHVVLRGSCIWRDRTEESGDLRRLDGQALGRPDKRVDGSPRIALDFPSGINAPASDFESWFGIGQNETPPVRFRIRQVTFLNADGSPSGGGDLKMPDSAGASVVLKAEEKIRGVRLVFTEPIQKESLGEGTAARIGIQKAGGPAAGQVVVAVEMEAEDVVRVTLRDPKVLQVGSYVLRARGMNADGVPGGILSVAGTPLDGNYDDQPGGDFVLRFDVG